MANFYKKPFIYIPKKKIVSGGGVTNITLGAYVNELITFKSSISNARVVIFWTTPQPKRTPSVPPLFLYDPTTRKNQQVNFSAQWSTSSSRLYMLLFRHNYTNANVEATIWNDPRNDFSSIVFPYIFLHVHYTANNEYHLYRISSADMFNTYRMTLHSSSYQLTNSNGYARGFYCDGTRYGNLRDNQTIQDKMQGSSQYDTKFIYFSRDVSDDEILNICQVYEMDNITQVETLTI